MIDKDPKKRTKRKKPNVTIEVEETRRLTDGQIDGMGSIFPGFAAWYRANYDEQGRRVGEHNEVQP